MEPCYFFMDLTMSIYLITFKGGQINCCVVSAGNLIFPIATVFILDGRTSDSQRHVRIVPEQFTTIAQLENFREGQMSRKAKCNILFYNYCYLYTK